MSTYIILITKKIFFFLNFVYHFIVLALENLCITLKIILIIIQKTYAVIPSAGLAQVRIFNTLNCPIPISIGEESFILQNLGVWENKFVEANGDISLNYTANFAECSNLGITDSLNGQIQGIDDG